MEPFRWYQLVPTMNSVFTRVLPLKCVLLVFAMSVICFGCERENPGNVLQSQTDAGDAWEADEDGWVVLSEALSSESEIVDAHELPVFPRQLECREAVFPTSGMDAVTESQWGVVVEIVVASDGLVERFRILRPSILSIDTVNPVAKALRYWRYESCEVGGVLKPFRMYASLWKPHGAGVTSYCSRQEEFRIDGIY